MATGALEGTVESIESLGAGFDPDNPDTIHETISDLHRVVAAVARTYAVIGTKLEDTGVHQSRWEALHEKSGQLTSLSDELEQEIGGGVVSR
jgi:hypothetical protein